MSGSASDGYIGKIVSLISTASIRYEGTIQAIDNDKITLKNVRIFGTEDRKCDVFIGMLNDIRPLISFNKSGISSIRIIPNYSFFDPSIVSGGEDLAREQQTMPPQRRNMYGYRNNVSEPLPAESPKYRGKFTPMGYENDGEEPITNDFDFEKSNQLFDKDDDIVDTAAPAYKKENFFDTLQESTKEKGMEGMNYYRGKDAETFGQKSLNERNRQNRGRYHRGGYRGRRGGYNGNRNNQLNESF